MIRCFTIRLAAMLAVFCAMPGHAATTRFGFKQIVVNGSSLVFATAINNSNTIVGTAAIGGVLNGFILTGGSATILPRVTTNFCASNDCVPHPTAINDRGDVSGYYLTGNIMGFLWRDDAYVPAYFLSLGLEQISNTIFNVNNHGGVIYNTATGGYVTAYAGTPPSVAPVGSGLGALVTGANNHGTVSGWYADPSVPTGAVFLTRNSITKTLLPPQAVGVAFGGFVNDHDQVAGSYTDTNNHVHGFVYAGGRYTSFDMPTTASEITVSAINNHGRVVGSYTDAASNLQRLFLYNGSTVSTFGEYPSTLFLRLALNDAGVMILGDLLGSYRILCAGSGC